MPRDQFGGTGTSTARRERRFLTVSEESHTTTNVVEKRAGGSSSQGKEEPESEVIVVETMKEKKSRAKKIGQMLEVLMKMMQQARGLALQMKQKNALQRGALLRLEAAENFWVEWSNREISLEEFEHFCESLDLHEKDLLDDFPDLSIFTKRGLEDGEAEGADGPPKKKTQGQKLRPKAKLPRGGLKMKKAKENRRRSSKQMTPSLMRARKEMSQVMSQRRRTQRTKMLMQLVVAKMVSRVSQTKKVRRRITRTMRGNMTRRSKRTKMLMQLMVAKMVSRVSQTKKVRRRITRTMRGNMTRRSKRTKMLMQLMVAKMVRRFMVRRVIQRIFQRSMVPRTRLRRRRRRALAQMVKTQKRMKWITLK